MATMLTSCRDSVDFADDPYGNFDHLAHIIDTRYCYLDTKGIDWPAITARYRAKITPETSAPELFRICGAMLNELKDGHVNLISRWDVSYYRKWWSEYPQDFDKRCLEEYYLKFRWNTAGGMMYARLGDAGYIYYPSFSNTVSESALDYALLALSECKALIIDIRDNGGGSLTNVDTLVSRFISSEITAGYISHKTGPGHSDFSEPYPFTYSPAEGHIMWHKPIYLLTNRSCYSAANNFAAIMRTLPNVILVGARTGGGGGMPFSSELPNGWSIRFSASPITDPQGRDIESGVDPTPGYECHAQAEDLAAGLDLILERALQEVQLLPDPSPTEHGLIPQGK